MLSFRKKVQNLSQSTTSNEVKDICSKILNETMGMPEYQFKRKMFEALNTVTEKDSASLEFYTRLNRDLSVDNLGVRESLETVKNLSTNDPQFLYRFKVYEYHIQNNIPEHTLVESFLYSIQPYIFNDNIKAVFDTISENYEANTSSIVLKNLLWEMEASNNKFLFQPLIVKIQEFIENPNKSLKDDLIFEMNRAALPQFLKALEVLKKENMVNENSVEIFHSNKDFSIDNVISPIFIDGAAKFFATKRNLYKVEENVLTKVDKADANPAWLSVLESFNFFNVDSKGVSKTVNNGKISFNLEENKFFLNETETTLAKLSGMGYFQYGNTEIATNLMKIAENRELIFDIDFAKEINSKLVESGIELFKVGTKIYANKFNPRMGLNELAEYTPIGIVKEAKDFLGIDISETFKKEVSTDNLKIVSIEEEQKDIKESIKSLKDTLLKLDEAMEKNPSIKEGIIDIQTSINEEIEAHQADWTKLEESKHAIINKVVNENGTESVSPNSVVDEKEKCTCKEGDDKKCKVCEPVNESRGRENWINTYSSELKQAVKSTKAVAKLLKDTEDETKLKEIWTIIEKAGANFDYADIAEFIDDCSFDAKVDVSDVTDLCEKIERKHGTEKQFPLEALTTIRISLERKYGKLKESVDDEVNDEDVNEEITVNEEENKFSIGDKVKTKSGETGEVTAINSNDSTVDILKDDGKTTTFSYDQLQSREKDIDKEEKDQEGKEDKPVNDKE